MFKLALWPFMALFEIALLLVSLMLSGINVDWSIKINEWSKKLPDQNWYFKGADVLSFIFWTSMLASIIVKQFDHSLSGLLFATLLLLMAFIAFCADLAANKVIRELNKRQS